jgi:hypothetical protein
LPYGSKSSEVSEVVVEVVVVVFVAMVVSLSRAALDDGQFKPQGLRCAAGLGVSIEPCSISNQQLQALGKFR